MLTLLSSSFYRCLINICHEQSVLHAQAWKNKVIMPAHALPCWCSSKYVGEGMSASMTGLALGFAVLVLGNIFLEEGVTEQLLTFNHSNFFV